MAKATLEDLEARAILAIENEEDLVYDTDLQARFQSSVAASPTH